MDFHPSDPHIRVPSFVPGAEDGDATPQPEPMDGGQFVPAANAPSRKSGTASPQAQAAGAAFSPDLSSYDLTVGEALGMFAREHRKRPSDRTLQRYCQDGRFECYKLKTTRNGNPVHEWIINSASLRAFIRTKPRDDTPADMAPSERPDAANGSAIPNVRREVPSSVIATPGAPDDAKDQLGVPRSSNDEPDAMTTPEETGDARDEQMTRVELLIENARLTAQFDAQEELVGELREDKRFMREEITQRRQNDRLLADMHRETLQTLKAVSLAGRYTKVELPGNHAAGEGSEMFRDVTESEQGDQRFPEDRV